mgnify:FL=1
MKKTLIVTAHPSSLWFTHKIAESYKKSIEENGWNAEILDLYKKENTQDFLRFENVKTDFPQDELTNKMHERISQADEIVLVAPIWWGQVPAIMKNFIDSNFWAWFAFQYAKGWKVIGLLKGKTARVFLTCDAPGFIYKFFPFANRLTGYFGMYLFGFCWMKISWVHIFDNMHKKSDEKSRNKMLTQVSNLAKKS